MVQARVLAVDPPGEGAQLRDAELRGQGLQPGPGDAVAGDVHAQPGTVRGQPCGGAQQGVQALVVHEARDGAHHEGVGRQVPAQPGACLVPVRRLGDEGRAHGVGAEHDGVLGHPGRDQAVAHARPERHDPVGAAGGLGLPLLEEPVPFRGQGLGTAHRRPCVRELPADLVHPRDPEGPRHGLDRERVHEVRGGVQQGRTVSTHVRGQQLGVLLDAGGLALGEPGRQQPGVVDPVHDIPLCRPGHADLHGVARPRHGGGIEALVPQGGEDRVAALGVPRAGVGQGVGQHVQHPPRDRAVAGLGRHGRGDAAERVPLPRHAAGEMTVAGMPRGERGRAAQVAAVRRQACGGGRPRRAAMLLRHAAEQRLGDVGPAHAEGRVGPVDQPAAAPRPRTGRADGPAGLVHAEGGQGRRALAPHLVAERGHDTVPAQAGEDVSRPARQRGRQPTGDLQGQQHRIVRHVLADGLGGQGQGPQQRAAG